MDLDSLLYEDDMDYSGASPDPYATDMSLYGGGEEDLSAQAPVPGVPEAPDLTGGLAPELVQGAIDRTKFSGEQNFGTLMAQLMPMAFAALSGGGADRYMNASAAGLSAGESARKGFGEENKKASELEMLGIKTGLAQQADSQRRRETFANQEKLQRARLGEQDKRSQANMTNQRTMLGLREESSKRIIDYNNKYPKPIAMEDTPADPQHIRDLKATIATIPGGESIVGAIPDRMSNKELNDLRKTWVGSRASNINQDDRIEKTAVKAMEKQNDAQDATVQRDITKFVNSQYMLGKKNEFTTSERESKQTYQLGRDNTKFGQQMELQDKKFGQTKDLQEDKQDFTAGENAKKLGIQKDLASFKADLAADAKKGGNFQQYQLDNIRAIATDLYEPNHPIWKTLPTSAEGMTAQEGNALALNTLKEGRVTRNQMQRQAEKRGEDTPGGYFHLDNPNNEVTGPDGKPKAKFTPEDKKTVQSAQKATDGIFRKVDHVAELYRTGAKQTLINQALDGLVVDVKTLQNMGANFTNMEAMLVGGQMGASRLEPTIDSVGNYIKSRVLMGSDYRKNIIGFKNEIASNYLDVLTSKRAGIDMDSLAATPDGHAFLDSLYKTPVGYKAMEFWDKQASQRGGGAAAGAAEDIRTGADGTKWKIIETPQGKRKVRL